MENDQARLNIEQFKIKRLIKSLETSKGNGTSMISLILPPKKQISDINKLLTEEYGKATNIKDRVNRQSVQAAMTSAKERLKLYNNKTPPNGLILYCGTILEPDGRTEKKLTISFEPFRPINTSLYFCDNKFHVEDLRCLLDNDNPIGFIVIDGSGALFATITGNTREILHKMTVELPKKHGRGGQSSVRFARLRTEKRHNYLTKVCEIALQVFISQEKANVTALILAGSADFKSELNGSQKFDPRLASKVIKLVDVSYGGENGLNQAIELCQESISQIKFVQEKKLIQKFFEEIAMESGKYVYSVDDTMRALESGAVETLLVYEGHDWLRLTLKNKATEKISYVHCAPENVNNPKFYYDKDTQSDLEAIEQHLLTEWLAENYNQFGAVLEFITNKSPEGFQFTKGFGGLGGFLRYKLDVEALVGGYAEEEDLEDDFI